MFCVFRVQRTPSSVDVRGNVPQDEVEFAEISKEPGWQRKWMENFAAINTGVNKPGEEDLVKDGWTDLSQRIQKAIGSIPRVSWEWKWQLCVDGLDGFVS